MAKACSCLELLDLKDNSPRACKKNDLKVELTNDVKDWLHNHGGPESPSSISRHIYGESH